jgi:hypothetical protein
MRRRAFRLGVTFTIGLAAVPGCGADDGAVQETEGTAETTSPGPVDPTPATSSAAATEGGDSTSVAGETGTDDSAVDSTGGGSSGGAGGCGAVDVLLVLDSSGSMEEKQASLHAALFEFAMALPTALATQDIHWLVADVDPWIYSGCEEYCVDAQNEGCFAGGTCSSAAGGDCALSCPLVSICGTSDTPPYVCGTTVPAQCEDTLGAGIVRPRGEGSSNTDCGLGPARYLESNAPDFGATFSCVSMVGWGSWANTETPVGATLAALSPRGEVGDCNAGFRRPDAALIVVFATDEDDTTMAGSPETWAADLTALAGGGPLVVGGLFGDTDQPGTFCQPLRSGPGQSSADAGVRLRAWTTALGPAAVTGSICVGDFEEFFTSVAERTAQACAGRE